MATYKNEITTSEGLVYILNQLYNETISNNDKKEDSSNKAYIIDNIGRVILAYNLYTDFVPAQVKELGYAKDGDLVLIKDDALNDHLSSVYRLSDVASYPNLVFVRTFNYEEYASVGAVLQIVGNVTAVHELYVDTELNKKLDNYQGTDKAGYIAYIGDDGNIFFGPRGIDGVATITGPEEIVDNTDPANPVINHDPTKQDLDQILSSLSSITAEEGALMLSGLETVEARKIFDSDIDMTKNPDSKFWYVYALARAVKTFTRENGSIVFTKKEFDSIKSFLIEETETQDYDIVGRGVITTLSAHETGVILGNENDIVTIKAIQTTDGPAAYVLTADDPIPNDANKIALRDWVRAMIADAIHGKGENRGIFGYYATSKSLVESIVPEPGYTTAISLTEDLNVSKGTYTISGWTWTDLTGLDNWVNGDFASIRYLLDYPSGAGSYRSGTIVYMTIDGSNRFDVDTDRQFFADEIDIHDNQGEIEFKLKTLGSKNVLNNTDADKIEFDSTANDTLTIKDKIEFEVDRLDEYDAKEQGEIDQLRIDVDTDRAELTETTARSIKNEEDIDALDIRLISAESEIDVLQEEMIEQQNKKIKDIDVDVTVAVTTYKEAIARAINAFQNTDGSITFDLKTFAGIAPKIFVQTDTENLNLISYLKDALRNQIEVGDENRVVILRAGLTSTGDPGAYVLTGEDEDKTPDKIIALRGWTQDQIAAAVKDIGRNRGIYGYYGSSREDIEAIPTDKIDPEYTSALVLEDDIILVGKFNNSKWLWTEFQPVWVNGDFAHIRYLLEFPIGNTWQSGQIVYITDVGPVHIDIDVDRQHDPDLVDINLNDLGQITLKNRTLVTVDGDKTVLNNTTADRIDYDGTLTILQAGKKAEQDFINEVARATGRENDIENNLIGTQQDLTNLTNRVTIAESDIDNVENRATSLENRVTVNEEDIVNIKAKDVEQDGRLDNLEQFRADEEEFDKTVVLKENFGSDGYYINDLIITNGENSGSLLCQKIARSVNVNPSSTEFEKIYNIKISSDNDVVLKFTFEETYPNSKIFNLIAHVDLGEYRKLADQDIIDATKQPLDQILTSLSGIVIDNGVLILNGQKSVEARKIVTSDVSADDNLTSASRAFDGNNGTITLDQGRVIRTAFNNKNILSNNGMTRVGNTDYNILLDPKATTEGHPGIYANTNTEENRIPVLSEISTLIDEAVTNHTDYEGTFTFFAQESTEDIAKAKVENTDPATYGSGLITAIVFGFDTREVNYGIYTSPVGPWVWTVIPNNNYPNLKFDNGDWLYFTDYIHDSYPELQTGKAVFHHVGDTTTDDQFDVVPDRIVQLDHTPPSPSSKIDTATDSAVLYQVIGSRDDLTTTNTNSIVLAINSIKTDNTTLDNRVTAEVSRLDGRIDDLTAKVDNNYSILDNKIDTVKNELQTEIDQTNSDLANEVTRATNAETDLQNQIISNDDDITALDARLLTAESDIDTLQSDLLAEVNRAEAAEQTLSDRVTVNEEDIVNIKAKDVEQDGRLDNLEQFRADEEEFDKTIVLKANIGTEGYLVTNFDFATDEEPTADGVVLTRTLRSVLLAPEHPNWEKTFDWRILSVGTDRDKLKIDLVNTLNPDIKDINFTIDFSEYRTSAEQDAIDATYQPLDQILTTLSAISSSDGVLVLNGVESAIARKLDIGDVKLESPLQAANTAFEGNDGTITLVTGKQIKDGDSGKNIATINGSLTFGDTTYNVLFNTQPTVDGKAGLYATTIDEDNRIVVKSELITLIDDAITADSDYQGTFNFFAQENTTADAENKISSLTNLSTRIGDTAIIFGFDTREVLKGTCTSVSSAGSTWDFQPVQPSPDNGDWVYFLDYINDQYPEKQTGRAIYKDDHINLPVFDVVPDTIIQLEHYEPDATSTTDHGTDSKVLYTILGIRSDLITIDKTNHVAAINEVKNQVNNADTTTATNYTILDDRITAEVATLNATIDTVKADLQANIDAENSRAVAAETILTNDLATEVQNRQDADNALQNQITSNDTDINTLISRVSAIEESLTPLTVSEVDQFITDLYTTFN